MSDIIESTDPTVLAFFKAKRERIYIETTLDQMDSMISAVTEEQLDSSILNAIDYINLAKPVSSYSTSTAVTIAAADPTYNYLILLGACYYIMKIKWTEWGHSGDQIQLSILSEPDRMDRFEAMMNGYKEEFKELAENYKSSSGIRVSRASYSSTSRNVGYGRGVATSRRGFKSSYRGY